MSLRSLMTTFAGRPIQRLDRDNLPDSADDVAWRIGFGGEGKNNFYDTPIPDPPDNPDNPDDDPEELPLGELLFQPLERWDQTPALQALVVSCWGDPTEFYDSDSAEAATALVALAPRLTSLEALFFGDIPRFMSDLAYIRQSDLGPVVRALPKLKSFGARGGEALRLTGLRHEALEELILETGGLRRSCVQDVASAHLPNLRRLDLWLGTPDYGGDATVDDLAPLLSGKLFPALTHLGLMNANIADAVAEALATAPIVERLEVLDLSLGTMTDIGLSALLKNPALKGLKRLDLSQNFLSDDAQELVRSTLPGVEVLTDDQKAAEGPEAWRYVTHGE